jgi:hypothetical protein
MLVEETEIVLEKGCLHKKLCRHVPKHGKKMLDLKPDCAATFVYKNIPRKLIRRTTNNIEGGD